MLLEPSVGTMIGGIVVWVFWIGLSVLAALYFIRGMRALAEIPYRLERIEHLLAAQQTARREQVP